jgi:hypothetical protein
VQAVIDVHTEHCCRFHGCKYGNRDGQCSVVKGALQSYPCENCDAEQTREIHEAQLPRCGALPRDRKDDNPCALREGHEGAIHRSATSAFLMTRPKPAPEVARTEVEGLTYILHEQDPNEPDSEPSVTRSEPPVLDPSQRSADRARQHFAMLLLQGAIEKAHGLGKGEAWEALHLIQAVLNRQEATIKRIQRDYLALVEQRLLPTANRETKYRLMELHEELEK